MFHHGNISARAPFGTADVPADGHFSKGTFWHGDFSAWGLFGMRNFRHRNISALGYFGTWTFRHRSTGPEMSVLECPYCFARCQNNHVLKCSSAKNSSCQKIPHAENSPCWKVHLFEHPQHQIKRVPKCSHDETFVPKWLLPKSDVPKWSIGTIFTQKCQLEQMSRIYVPVGWNNYARHGQARGRNFISRKDSFSWKA